MNSARRYVRTVAVPLFLSRVRGNLTLEVTMPIEMRQVDRDILELEM